MNPTPDKELSRITLQLRDREAEVERFNSVIKELLKSVGDYVTCYACGQLIYLVRHRNGRRVSYDPDGVHHLCRIKRGR